MLTLLLIVRDVFDEISASVDVGAADFYCWALLLVVLAARLDISWCLALEVSDNRPSGPLQDNTS